MGEREREREGNSTENTGIEHTKCTMHVIYFEGSEDTKY
jgi:hypothetical protein